MPDPVRELSQPQPRPPFPELLSDSKHNEHLGYIQAVLDSNAHISAIVNHQKQIVLSNEHLVKIAGLDSLDRIIGNRPGEALSCIQIATGGVCTSTTGCRFCGINQTIHDSQILNKRISAECRITTRVKDRLVSHDFQVTCTPIQFGEEQYTLLHLVDISSDKRNEMLEKVFFHDLLNRLGGFSGLVQVMRSENKQPELEEFIDLLDTIGEMAIEDIQTQRFLKAAEDANLILNIREFSAYEIMESVRKQISFHLAMKTKKIFLCTECPDFVIKTDGSLLKRILLNMVKNAAEATPDNGTINIICKKESRTALFSVHNDGVIAENISLQIFQRSFSTKGNGRGLGTYSMKLFGENYLKGKVYFTSDAETGTVFTIELPVTPE